MRQENNILIASKILEVCKNPNNADLRFGQILANMGIIQYTDQGGITIPLDPYNDESDTIYNRVKAN